jgi:pimeloyl-ACP methyl ester carboxylesterase
LTWALEDYAKAIEAALLDRGIRSGWLLAESFGSLVGWEIVGRANRAAESPGFEPLGLVLAGGFVRHPLPWGARLMHHVGKHTSQGAYQTMLNAYTWSLKRHHRHAPELLASLAEFVERRTALDRLAMRRRLDLVADTDPRPIARRAKLPVHHLGGGVDPVVPWPGVRWWLRRHCPGYRSAKTCWLADHNVLATATRQSAATVLAWMQAATSRTPKHEG